MFRVGSLMTPQRLPCVFPSTNVGGGRHMSPQKPYMALQGPSSRSCSVVTNAAASPGAGTPSMPDGEEDWVEGVKTYDVMTLPNLRSALGEPMLSPLASRDGSDGGGFVGDKDVVMLKAVQYESLDSAGAGCDGLSVLASQDMSEGCIPMASWATRAGPRKLIYHDPKTTTAAIVTCGGLCPGLNDIIQNIVYMLADYGVPEEQILGVRYGLRGFIDRKLPPIPLHRAEVDGIQLKGGTILGTSRGNAQIHEIVKRLDLWGVNMLFVLGGNGGNAAAEAIHEECVRENVLCSVVAVPKSIDNDILVIDKTFGFETAVEEAQRAILAAKVEASSAYRGVGIVRLMGRQSGFVSMNASLASGVVDICLIPEVKFELPKVLTYIDKVLEEKGHCVICVAEGAGQDLDQATGITDASGNPILNDFGVVLRNAVKKEVREADVKYIDPSYMIRSIPTVTQDRIYCTTLAQGAVHAAFAGYSGTTVGLVNTHFCYLPIPAIIQAARFVDPRGRQWNRLRMANRQPDFF